MAHPTGSVVLFAWVGAILGTFTGPALVTVVRSQLVVLYGFAATHKAVSAEFMSGSVIAKELAGLPRPELAALAVFAGEAFLALAVWRGWRAALPAAMVAHVSFVAGMSQNAVHAVALGAFNLHAILLVWFVVADGHRVLEDRRARREAPAAVDVRDALVVAGHRV